MSDTFWTDVPATYAPDGTLLTPAVPAPPVVDPAAVRPSVDDVAALERSRTIDEDGNDQGTFTATTSPTATEVGALIDEAQDEVLGQLPPNMDELWYPAVKRLIALRTASAIEVSYFRNSNEAPAMTRATDTPSPRAAGTAMAHADQFAAELAALRGLIPQATRVA